MLEMEYTRFLFLLSLANSLSYVIIRNSVGREIAKLLSVLFLYLEVIV